MDKLRRKGAAIVLMGAGFAALAGGFLLDEAHRPRWNVALFEGPRETDFSTTAGTVGEALRDRGIALKPEDVVVPPLGAPVTEGIEIDLGVVERRERDVKKPLVHPVDVTYTDDLNVGEIIDVAQGKDGLEELRTESFFLNGEAAFEKTLSRTVLTPAQDAKVLEGTSLRQKMYRLAKRARVKKVLTLNASAYYPGPEDTWPYASGYTSTHMKAGYGVAAVDPRVIRLKTPLYVEGYGYAVAGDVGGAIKGNRIDLCFDTYEEAVRFGRKDVRVYILR